MGGTGVRLREFRLWASFHFHDYQEGQNVIFFFLLVDAIKLSDYVIIEEHK